MEVRTKLRACVILSAIALVFKIIATASPGWTVVKTHVMFNPMEDITPEEDGIRIDDLEVMEMKPSEQKVSISFGLWYYRVCKCGKGKDGHGSSSSEEDSSEEVANPEPEIDDGDEHRHGHKRHHRRHHRKCYFRCYRRNKHHKKHHDDVIMETDEHYDEVPKDFAAAEDFIVGAVEVARHARHELAWYAAVGLGLGVVGMIGAVLFARGGGMGKHTGRLATSTQVLSAFFFWMAIIRVASYMIQLKKGSELMENYGDKSIDFECPWCLWVAAVGASVMGLASLFHLIMVSRDKKNKPSEYIVHSDQKVPIIAPRGYEQLIVPPMYEEAGPLPEKKPIE